MPFIAPSNALGQLFTCIVIAVGTIAFAAFNAEVHHIVQQSLGATLARTLHINNLRKCFGKARAGGVAQTTALKWSTASAAAERLKGDNARETALVNVLPPPMRN